MSLWRRFMQILNELTVITSFEGVVLVIVNEYDEFELSLRLTESVWGLIPEWVAENSKKKWNKKWKWILEVWVNLTES